MLKTIFEQLNKIISPVYLVGGSVRDNIMGTEQNDFDFCTPLTPDEIELAIKASGKRCYNIGKKFGTLGVKIEGEIIEITSFRTESYKEGSRKPLVEFVSDIREDLSRRDFTINAIALDVNGKLLDPFGGKADIDNRILKAVGNPTLRIKEDPLRMLRCARFMCKYGFSVDEALVKSIKKHSHLILSVSRERWMMEMNKILSLSNPSVGFRFMGEVGLLKFMIPELALQVGYEQNSPHHDFTLFEHTLKVVDAVPQESLNLRWAALLHDVAKPFVRTDKKDRSNYILHELLGAEIVEKTARYLKWSNEMRETVKALVANHLQEDSELKVYDDACKLED